MMRSERELTVTTLLKRGGLRGTGNVPVDGTHARILAEAVILQCMEDMCDPEHCEESREFFQGEGFIVWAEMASMSLSQQIKLIRILTGNEIPSLKVDARKESLFNGSENTYR